MLFWRRIIRTLRAEAMGQHRSARLFAAGLDEQSLRAMDPDDRVEALEKAGLDPYDYIYLAY